MPDHKSGRARKVFLLQYRADGKVRRETIGDWEPNLAPPKLDAGLKRCAGTCATGAIRWPPEGGGGKARC